MTNNKILEAVQEHIDDAFSKEHMLLKDALNRIFWSDENQDYLVPLELIEDLITLITNPVEYYDCTLNNATLLNKLKDQFRTALRENKEYI